jgi:hypothetical protein
LAGGRAMQATGELRSTPTPTRPAPALTRRLSTHVPPPDGNRDSANTYSTGTTSFWQTIRTRRPLSSLARPRATSSLRAGGIHRSRPVSTAHRRRFGSSGDTHERGWLIVPRICGSGGRSVSTGSEQAQMCELRHSVHRRQQARTRPALALQLVADPCRRDEAGVYPPVGDAHVRWICAHSTSLDRRPSEGHTLSRITRLRGLATRGHNRVAGQDTISRYGAERIALRCRDHAFRVAIGR